MAQPANLRPDADALVRSVWWTLRVVFGVVPVVAGLDKFFDLLVAWDKYLSPSFRRLIPMSPSAFMHLAGVVEIIVGLGVLFTPWTRVFAWIAAIWLWCIALDLVTGGFYDVAVRDIVMGISALCLARLTVLVPLRVAQREPGPLHAPEAQPGPEAAHAVGR
jgi:uncharacterized membrane protein YphA (DoxX/SURF4 family)